MSSIPRGPWGRLCGKWSLGSVIWPNAFGHLAQIVRLNVSCELEEDLTKSEEKKPS